MWSGNVKRIPQSPSCSCPTCIFKADEVNSHRKCLNKECPNKTLYKCWMNGHRCKQCPCQCQSCRSKEQLPQPSSPSQSSQLPQPPLQSPQLLQLQPTLTNELESSCSSGDCNGGCGSCCDDCDGGSGDATLLNSNSFAEVGCCCDSGNVNEPQLPTLANELESGGSLPVPLSQQQPTSAANALELVSGVDDCDDKHEEVSGGGDVDSDVITVHKYFINTIDVSQRNDHYKDRKQYLISKKDGEPNFYGFERMPDSAIYSTLQNTNHCGFGINLEKFMLLAGDILNEGKDDTLQIFGGYVDVKSSDGESFVIIIKLKIKIKSSINIFSCSYQDAVFMSINEVSNLIANDDETLSEPLFRIKDPAGVGEILNAHFQSVKITDFSSFMKMSTIHTSSSEPDEAVPAIDSSTGINTTSSQLSYSDSNPPHDIIKSPVGGLKLRLNARSTRGTITRYQPGESSTSHTSEVSKGGKKRTKATDVQGTFDEPIEVTDKEAMRTEKGGKNDTITRKGHKNGSDGLQVDKKPKKDFDDDMGYLNRFTKAIEQLTQSSSAIVQSAKKLEAANYMTTSTTSSNNHLTWLQNQFSENETAAREREKSIQDTYKTNLEAMKAEQKQQFSTTLEAMQVQNEKYLESMLQQQKEHQRQCEKREADIYARADKEKQSYIDFVTMQSTNYNTLTSQLVFTSLSQNKEVELARIASYTAINTRRARDDDDHISFEDIEKNKKFAAAFDR